MRLIATWEKIKCVAHALDQLSQPGAFERLFVIEKRKAKELWDSLNGDLEALIKKVHCWSWYHTPARC